MFQQCYVFFPLQRKNRLNLIPPSTLITSISYPSPTVNANKIYWQITAELESCLPNWIINALINWNSFEMKPVESLAASLQNLPPTTILPTQGPFDIHGFSLRSQEIFHFQNLAVFQFMELKYANPKQIRDSQSTIS